MPSPRAITDPDIAKALAHPLRMRLLSLFEEGTASPTELADLTGASLPRVSYHVRRLAAAGLIELVRTKQRRGAVEHYYTAVQQPAITEEAWAPLPKVVKSAVAGATLEHIREEINAAISGGGFERPEVHVSRSVLVVDQEGWQQLSRRMETLLEDVRNIVIASQSRLEENGRESAVEAMAIMMLFEKRTAGLELAAGAGTNDAQQQDRRKPPARKRKRAASR